MPVGRTTSDEVPKILDPNLTDELFLLRAGGGVDAERFTPISKILDLIEIPTSPPSTDFKVVADAAALRASTDEVDAIFIPGETGGWFSYDAASTDTDDGVLVITRTDSRRYRRMHTRMSVNVLWYGAVGDGVTDDYAAFQAAIDTGHTVEIPNGIYSISDTLICNTSGQIIRGESMVSTWLVYPNDVDGFAFDEATNTNFPVQAGFSAGANQNGGLYNCRLSYSGGGISATSIGVKNLPNSQIGGGYNCESTELEDVQVENWFIGIDIQYASKFRVNHCNAKTCDTGYYAHGATNNCFKWHMLNVNNCRVGIHLDECNGGQITLGDFALTTDYGVLMEGGQCSFEGGELESFGPGPFFSFFNSNVSVKGCRFLNNFSHPVEAGGGSTVICFNNIWGATVPSDPGYVPAFAKQIDAATQILGFNGGLFKIGDLGNVAYQVSNRILRHNGQFCQMSWTHRGIARDTYTITEDFEGVIQQEDYAFRAQGGSLVSWGINGLQERFKYDMADLNLRGATYSASTNIPDGWEGFIIKDGGIMNLRDTLDPALRATPQNPKVICIYNSGAGSLTIGRYNNLETATINGVDADASLGPKEMCWMATTGNGNWMMVGGSANVGTPGADGDSVRSIVTEATTARTITVADAGAYIRLTNGSSCTLTLPTNATEDFASLGGPATIYFRVASTGVPTLTNPGVTVNDPAGVIAGLGGGDSFALQWVATNEWDVI